MSFSFENKGKPNGTAVIYTLLDNAVTLSPPAGTVYAILQVYKDGSVFKDDRVVLSYTVDGSDPKEQNKFLLGHTDYRLFEKGELKAGVKIVNAEPTVSCKVIVQYYSE